MFRVTNSLGEFLMHTADKQLLKNYVNSQRTTVTLTHSETGDVTFMAPNPVSYPFARVGVHVRVHPDDRQTILDSANFLNEARRT